MKMQGTFKCTDIQVLHFFYTKFWNFWHTTRLSPINCRKVINAQIQSVFWPTIYTLPGWTWDNSSSSCQGRQQSWPQSSASLYLGTMQTDHKFCNFHNESTVDCLAMSVKHGCRVVSLSIFFSKANADCDMYLNWLTRGRTWCAQ